VRKNRFQRRRNDAERRTPWTKINLSVVLAGQNVGIKEVSDRIWLVSFMDYDLGFFDHETGRLGTAENPFAAKVLPMCPV
jgi:putative transposase